MRLLPGLIALAGLIPASATYKLSAYNTPPSTSSSSSSSSSSSHSKSAPELSGSQATLALAHRLGLSRFHSVRPADDHVVTLLTQPQHGGHKDAGEDLFGGVKKDGQILVQISGVDGAKLFPGVEPVFVSDEEDAARVVEELLRPGDNSWVGRGKLYSVNDHSPREKQSHAKIYIAPAPSALYLWNEENWRNFVNLVGADLAEHFDESKSNDKMFALSFTELAHTLSKSAEFETARDNGALVSLSIPLLTLFPENSQQYSAALHILRDFFADLSPHLAKSTTLLVSSSPRVHEHTPPETLVTELKARKEIPLSAIPSDPVVSTTPPLTNTQKDKDKDKPKKPSVPITRVPRFFDSKSKCETQTNECSSRGKCVQTSTRWACRCESSLETTRSGKGKERVYWAGNACQKQDISAPFHLFLVFTIVIILAIVGAISAMYSMGGEELPGVLTAAQVHHKRQ